MRLIDTNYGSNAHGLIWGYRFVPGQPAQPFASEDVAAFLASDDEREAGSFLWLHFSLSNTGAERFLTRQLSLPDAFHESLRSEVGSTRLELDDGALVAVVHDVLFGENFETSEVGTTSLYIGPRMMISARLRPLRSVDKLRAAVRAEQPFRSPVELLAHLLRDQAAVLEDIVRKSTQKGTTSKTACWRTARSTIAPSSGRCGVRWSACDACWRRSPPPCSACSTGRRSGSIRTTCATCNRPPRNSPPQSTILRRWPNGSS